MLENVDQQLLLCIPDFACYPKQILSVFLLMFRKYYTQILYSDVVYDTIFSLNIYITIKEELSKNYRDLCVQRE